MWLKIAQFWHRLLGPLLKFLQGCNHGISRFVCLAGAWDPHPNSNGSENSQDLLDVIWKSPSCPRGCLQLQATWSSLLASHYTTSLLPQGQLENLIFLSTETKNSITQHLYRRDNSSPLSNLFLLEAIHNFYSLFKAGGFYKGMTHWGSP